MTDLERAMARVAQSGDPLMLQRLLWPDVMFYGKQRDIIYSIRDSVETYVPAGNMLGKDYVGGFIALSFFLCPMVYFSPQHVASVERLRGPHNQFPHFRRVLTTSVKADHLRVLWAEIGRFVTGSALPLTDDKGGPLTVLHQEIRLASEGRVNGKNLQSYLLAQVTNERGEGMAGHHAPYTLCIADEASGVGDKVYEMQQGWAKRLLAIGNPNPCNNFFFRGIEAGDLAARSK